MHFFHVLPLQHAQLTGGYGGIGGVDELLASATADPDADAAVVAFLCNLALAYVSDQSIYLCILEGIGGIDEMLAFATADPHADAAVAALSKVFQAYALHPLKVLPDVCLIAQRLSALWRHR